MFDVRISYYWVFTQNHVVIKIWYCSPTKKPKNPAGPTSCNFKNTNIHISLAKRQLLLEKLKSLRTVKLACSDNNIIIVRNIHTFYLYNNNNNTHVDDIEEKDRGIKRSCSHNYNNMIYNAVFSACAPRRIYILYFLSFHCTLIYT